MRPWWLSGKESTCQCRRRGFTPWVRKMSCRRKWTTHCSILAWKIRWTEEPGGPWNSRVGHNSATKQPFLKFRMSRSRMKSESGMLCKERATFGVAVCLFSKYALVWCRHWWFDNSGLGLFHDPTKDVHSLAIVTEEFTSKMLSTCF